ncbi:Histidine kinase CKI1 [Linum perenne]
MLLLLSFIVVARFLSCPIFITLDVDDTSTKEASGTVATVVFAKLCLVNNNNNSVALAAVLYCVVVLSLATLVWKKKESTQRELHLCASLIKQMEATQQAERKSMNKTLLDINRIELENEEDFNLGKLLEEVVDRFYIVGMKKGVDVVFDPSHGFILKSTCVHGGSQMRLTQILSNLLHNALKFTSEGHVTVRATVMTRRSFNKDIIAYNRIFKGLWDLCGKHNTEDCCDNDLNTLEGVYENPDEVEFVFEVDDTGKGIPKDGRKLVFEDYIQATNNDNSGGYGLGLGNVQSLVRLMKGELQIVEKEAEEKGTCFRFNVFLPVNGQQQQRQQCHWLTFRPFTKREDYSHVMIMIQGEERRKVLKKLIESMNIKVSIIDQSRSFCQELERINTKIQTKVILLVIDVNYYDADLRDCLCKFKTGTNDGFSWKMVWLQDSWFAAQDGGDDRLQETKYDYLVYKPFHGSRVMQVLSLLPAGKGTSLPPIGDHNATLAPPMVKFKREFASSSNCWTIELGDNVNNDGLVSLRREEIVSVTGDDAGGEKGGIEKE